MAISANKQHQVLAILTKTITAEPTPWKKIVEAVSAEMTIKNWLDVRGVLQYMINNNMVKRVASVHVEDYTTV
jgi:hypothetical protein